VIGTHRRRKSASRLYILDTLRLPSSTTSPTHVLSTASVSTPSFTQWHHRLGHLCGSRLSTLIKSGCLCHTSVESSLHCKGCKLGKQIQLPYFSSDSHSANPLILFTVMFGVLLLLFQKVAINIMLFSLMIILVILGFILRNTTPLCHGLSRPIYHCCLHCCLYILLKD
jgi:hypothetical protein